MTLIRTIQIRLSREQYNRIKSDAMAFGLNSLSGYLRYLALGRDLILEKKIDEIYEKIVGTKEKRKVKINKFPPFVDA